VAHHAEVATRNRDRLDALTGIRPFASLFVFFFHFGRPLVAAAPPPLRALAGSGFVAVSFFYVLSGFVLTVGQRAAFAQGRFDHRRFLARRLGRLAPAHLIMWALLLPLALAPALGAASGAFVDAPARRVASGLLHLVLAQAWWPPLASSWNIPAWSISVELAFYIGFPFLVTYLLRLPRRRLFIPLAVAWIATLAVTGAYGALAPDGAVDPDRGALWIDFVKYWPPLRLPEFAFGATLAVAFDRAGPPAPRWLGPLALALVAATLTQAERLPYAMLHNALLLPAFGAIVWAVASARGRVAARLSSPALVRLGRASYEIYIVQMPLMYYVMVATHAGWLRWSGAGFVLRFGALVLVVALSLHALVDRWLQPRAERLLGRLFSAGARPSPARSPSGAAAAPAASPHGS
jgi:peptidoglycan/LPS O-acetylase OafA/YrhL